MLERIVNRYLSWVGLFIVGILVCGFIWNWRLLSVTLSFTGLLAVILTAMATDEVAIGGIIKSKMKLTAEGAERTGRPEGKQ